MSNEVEDSQEEKQGCVAKAALAKQGSSISKENKLNTINMNNFQTASIKRR